MKNLTLIDKAFILKNFPLFSELDLDLLLPIADKLQVLVHDAGDIIFSKGEDAYRMYFIAKGSVLLRGSNPGISIDIEHDFFGDEAIFSEEPRAYEAVCKTKVVLLALSRTTLLSIISECPSVATTLLHVYTKAFPFRHRK